MIVYPPPPPHTHTQTSNTVVPEIINLKVDIGDIHNSLAPGVFKTCGTLATNGLIHDTLF